MAAWSGEQGWSSQESELSMAEIRTTSANSNVYTHERGSVAKDRRNCQHRVQTPEDRSQQHEFADPGREFKTLSTTFTESAAPAVARLARHGNREDRKATAKELRHKQRGWQGWSATIARGIALYMRAGAWLTPHRETADRQVSGLSLPKYYLAT